MKNLILLLIAFAFVGTIEMNAQVGVYTMTHSGDTVTNTGTKSVLLEVKNYYPAISIQAKVVKISGTVAGTLTLQGSNDGVNYVTVDTGVTASEVVTFTATNVATQTVIFQIVKGSPYRYYQVSHTGTGTMASRLYGYLLAQK